MERAFLGPLRLSERLGTPQRLVPSRIAAYDPERCAALVATPPAVHRFPGSMAGRIQGLAQTVSMEYADDAAAIWRGVPTGSALFERLVALPGFGEQKSRIFVALLGKQCAVRPRGWREAAGAYGDARSHRRSLVRDSPGRRRQPRRREVVQAGSQGRGASPLRTRRRHEGGIPLARGMPEACDNVAPVCPLRTASPRTPG